MNDFLKNLRNNQQQYDAKYKGQAPRKKQGGGNTKKPAQNAKGGDSPLLIILGELVPSIKAFLEATIDNQTRLTTAKEKQAEAMTKIAEAMPDYIRSQAPMRKLPRRRKIDEKKQKTLDLIKRLRDENMTYEEVAAYLDENHVPTFSGRGRWHAQTIHRLYMYYP